MEQGNNSNYSGKKHKITDLSVEDKLKYIEVWRREVENGTFFIL